MGIRVAQATDGAGEESVQAASAAPVHQPGAEAGLGNAQDGPVEECNVDDHGAEEEGCGEVEKGPG